ncbi:hypothetical protein BH24ACI3_BH24ACI3_09360 [soil metagenome]
MKLLILFAIVFALVTVGSGQAKILTPGSEFAAERELAKLAIKAHGGEKLRSMKTLVIRGTADVTVSTQRIPVTFVNIFAGDRYRFELTNPFQPIEQVSDGTTTTSSARGGFTLPPVNRLGFPVLQRIGDTGFIVTSLRDNKKKQRGFRVTSPEGYFNDFFLDPKTNQIKGYDSTFAIDGRTVKTSVEIDKFRMVDGVLVPERYVQRFDLDQFTVYASFKASEILVNSELSDDIFTVGK